MKDQSDNTGHHEQMLYHRARSHSCVTLWFSITTCNNLINMDSMDGWMENRWMVGWKDAWMDGWLNGWMDR